MNKPTFQPYDNLTKAPQPQVPIIGQPHIAAATVVILLVCNCEAHVAIQATAGPTPIVCPSCRNEWVVGAEINLNLAASPASHLLS